MIDKINRKGHLNKKTFKILIAIVMATTTMAVGFEEIEYEKKDFTVYICFIVVFNCLQ